MQTVNDSALESTWKKMCAAGGIAALAQVACALVTMIVAFGIGGEPESAGQFFDWMARDRFAAVLRLDFASLVSTVFYYFTIFGVYAALRRVNGAFILAAMMFSFIGITLWLSSHSSLSLLNLYNQYAGAADPELKSRILTAGDAILASNMWHSSGAFVGGYLAQFSALGISILMLTGNVFGRLIAVIGIVTHGLDLAHIVVGPFLPTVSVALMAVAGTLYLPWFVLLGLRMLKIGRGEGRLVAGANEGRRMRSRETPDRKG
ncbi:MAG: hypothetical protein JXD23_13890 [Spirochaetales bacterium]|nr:hypothetical protein [Spirochaetales bacterium]